MRSFAKTLCFSTLLANLVLTGCTIVPPWADLNYPYQTALQNQTDDDAQLSQKLQDMISASYPSTYAAVQVMTDHYNVLITGQVDSQATRDKIDSLVKAQPIVRDYYNYTTIHAAPKLYYNNSLAQKARDRIAAETNITIDSVHATSVENVVYVMGEIKQDEGVNIERVLAGIYAIPGVNKVVNLTTVTAYGTKAQ